MLNWQWVLSDILGENSIKKRRSNSFQKAFERRLCFDRVVGVTGIFERISFLLQKSLFVFHDHRISFCGIYFTENTHEVAMKTFVDFYAISKASRVIRILAPEMYNTVFSYYAAVLGGIIPEELHV